jgi:predicted O-methyltransferase YrrM
MTAAVSVEPAIAAAGGDILRRFPSLERILEPIAQLRWPERLLMYTITYALRPRYVLEIGTAQGGSAQILCAALDDRDLGRLVCVDMQFQISDPIWKRIAHRATLVEGMTPGVFPKVREAATEPFDFAFIDGDHSYEGLLADIDGTLPLLADRAALLFHDSHHDRVRHALDDAVQKHAEVLADFGELSFERTTIPPPGPDSGDWGGLRLLGFDRNRQATRPVRDDSREKLSEQAARIDELESERDKIWEEKCSIARAFDERGVYIQDLEQRFRRLWDEKNEIFRNLTALQEQRSHGART